MNERNKRQPPRLFLKNRLTKDTRKGKTRYFGFLFCMMYSGWNTLMNILYLKNKSTSTTRASLMLIFLQQRC